ncbi:MAG: cation transporter [Halapricum sp.]
MSLTITVEGMSCEHCEQTVTEALEEIDDVTAASADHEADVATIEGAADTVALVAAVEEAGYDASA